METRTKVLIKVLEGMESLVADDNELYEIMEDHGFTALVERAKQAEESDDPNLLLKIAGELQDFSSDVWSLAHKKGIPYYAHDIVEAHRFFERDPNTSSQAEKVYNLLGFSTINLALQFLYKTAQIQVAAKAKST